MSSYLYPQYGYAVLDTIQALAADVSVANQTVSIGNPLVPLFKWPTLRAGKCRLIASVAETLQVTTLTPVAANSSTYAFVVQQYDITNRVTITRTYTHTTPAAGGTATTIGDNFRAQINADSVLKIVASGTTTLILTAEAGYPIFTVLITNVGGGLTQATGVAGVRSVGTQADLAREGITVSGAAYWRFHVEYDKLVGDTNTSPTPQHQVFDWFIQTGATNRAALTTRLGEILATFATGGSVVDPEILAVA